MLNTLYSCHILMKLQFSQQIFEKSCNFKFHENPYSGRRVFPCGKTERRTDMTKLIVAFRNFADAPKTHFLCSYHWHLGIIMLTVMAIQCLSVRYFYCADTSIVRPITETTQEIGENSSNNKPQTTTHKRISNKGDIR